MPEFFSWRAHDWALHVLLLQLLLLAISVAGVLLIYVAKFYRPKNIGSMFSASIPAVNEIAGSVSVLGQKLSANASLDTQQDTQIANLENRIVPLEEAQNTQQEVLNAILERLKNLEGIDG